MRRIAMIAAIVLLSNVGHVEAVVLFDDGGIHYIDYTISDSVEVRDDFFFGNPTTVNLLSGGHIGSELAVYGDSQAIISGGTVNEALRSYDNGQITIFSGDCGYLSTYGNSQAVIDRGTVIGIGISDTSRVTISGGLIEFHLYSYGNSQVEITGG
ncbi:MAG: hypothetical protein JXM70_07085, partial [Pirellulales bacterium]|nr:hypothetical protein [Pirellulales bacterium]